MYFEQKIEKIIKSKYKLIYIFTEEEERLEKILSEITYKIFNKKLCTWDFIQGYDNQPDCFNKCKQNPLEALSAIEEYNQNQAVVFFLKDFHFFLDDLSINRKIKNLYKWLKNDSTYLILSGTEQLIPQNLQEYIKYVTLPLPDKKEIAKELKIFLLQGKIKNIKYENTIYEAYKGLTIKKIRTSITKLLSQPLTKSEILKKIFEEKKQTIDSINGLEFCNIKNNQIDLGGLTNLQKWLRIRNLVFSSKADIYGINIPKGILLVGIQGTGKSLSAITIAKEWSIPLLKLNIGQIFGNTLGESEKQITRVIETCTNLSPCILWIDEIDKIFVKQIHNSDSGTTQRVTNIFLTWLSDKKDKIFIIATANRIEQIPIEMLRKGRFDEIFFVDLPNFRSRMRIFQIQIKKMRPLTWNQYNIYFFSKISKGFSGAEIEQTIIEAMYIAFNENREFTSKDIVKSINRIIPLSKTHSSELLVLRKWGYSGKARIA
uniref:Uncharacterized AAA domain-containing protein ycf46 n=1 Tax=Polysiphonia sertularioides TaxID=945028 RepID=A0A1Z1M8I2_9FLOR|nr:hypothetical protein [Polysiphonia sertularioides]ARW62388.1 hypothetical protein [Polysiphonia sertularioides]